MNLRYHGDPSCIKPMSESRSVVFNLLTHEDLTEDSLKDKFSSISEFPYSTWRKTKAHKKKKRSLRSALVFFGYGVILSEDAIRSFY